MAHSIGKTIAELRKAKCWTQIELAEKILHNDEYAKKKLAEARRRNAEKYGETYEEVTDDDLK